MLIKDLLGNQQENDKIAIICGNESISYREIHNKAQMSAQKLVSANIGCYSIGLFIPDSINYISAYFSISFADKVIVPINPRIKTNELKSTIEYCELRIIVTDLVNIELLRKYLKNYLYEIRVFNIDIMSFEFMGGSIALPVSENNELEDVALMLHTSGSLSAPKRVMLTHENLISCIKSIIESLGITQTDRTLIALPMFLASANTSQMLTHVYLGASMVIMDALFTPGYFLKSVEMHKVTNFTGVPFMMLSLTDNKNIKGYDISSLHFICFGGAPTPADKIKLLIDSFPDIGFIHMYGQTETSTRISHLPPEEMKRKIGSAGKPIPGMEWRLIDEYGRDVQEGDVGEIIVKGKNVMKGYYKRNEQTQKIIISGWLYTGDLGRFDEDGFLYIVGRRKNVIIKGGMNIYPEEIEEILMQHPAIREAYVFAKKHELLGEVPIARIVLHNDMTGTNEAELLKYCFKNLSSFKMPVSIQFVKELPRTDTGKIMRI